MRRDKGSHNLNNKHQPETAAQKGEMRPMPKIKHLRD
jgi:hypothetical protein